MIPNELEGIANCFPPFFRFPLINSGIKQMYTEAEETSKHWSLGTALSITAGTPAGLREL